MRRVNSRHAVCRKTAYVARATCSQPNWVELACLRGAAGTVRAARAVVVSAEVDGLAAEGAAVVDERLGFLDGHCVDLAVFVFGVGVCVGIDRGNLRQGWGGRRFSSERDRAWVLVFLCSDAADGCCRLWVLGRE